MVEGAVVGLFLAIFLFTWGVDSISLGLGETMGIMGIWLTLGVLVGQNRAHP